MGDTIAKYNNEINVTFLGERYSFPGELAQYVTYCNEFEKINDRLMNKLFATMKKAPMQKGDSSYTDMREMYEGYMQDEGRKFITMLSKIGVYDVTESDVIFSNKGYVKYTEIKTQMNVGSSKILQNSMNNWMAEHDNIYSSSVSDIRGSRYGFLSNSFLALATFSAMEYCTLKRQAKEADRQYLHAMDELNKRNNSEMDRKYIQFYATEIYPQIADAFNMFTSELMSIYLIKLHEKGLFDTEKISNYSLKKSAEILNNIELVDNKKAVLIEAYKVCPFNPDIYAEVMAYDLFDVETMKGVKEFHQETMLVGIMEDKIRSNLNNFVQVKDYTEVLAYYLSESKTDILKTFYENTIRKIKSDYQSIFLLCTDSRKLCTWICDYISGDPNEVASTSEVKVVNKVDSWMKKTFDNIQYENLSSIGFISIDDIKYKNSTKSTLAEVQAEYKDKMITLILEYIKKIQEEKITYEEAYEKYNLGLKKYMDAIAEKNDELNQQGLFAFSKKKEIKAEMEKMNNMYDEYRKTEPVSLKKTYFNTLFAVDIPVWHSENCIQCNFCSYVCPHAAIRSVAMTKEEAAKMEGVTLPLTSMPQYKFTIAVSAPDCTGCGFCINVCPGMKGEKALAMDKLNKHLDEQKFSDYAVTLPIKDDVIAKFKETTIKGSAFKHSLLDEAEAKERYEYLIKLAKVHYNDNK